MATLHEEDKYWSKEFSGSDFSIDETKTIRIFTKHTRSDKDIILKIPKATDITGLGSIATGDIDNSEWLQNTEAVIPANGYLYINAGYFPNTQISLATLIPDDADYTNAGSAQLRKDFEAYDSDGNKLIGTIPNWEPPTEGEEYYTTTNTGFGAITQSSYVNSSEALYIKAGSISIPTGAETALTTVLSGTDITLTRNLTPDITAGWLADSVTGVVSTTATVPTEEITVTLTDAEQTISPSNGKLIAKVTVPAVDASSATEVLGTASITTSLDIGNMSTYFDEGTTEKSDVILIPKYTSTEGYTSAVSDINKGGTSYWTIKNGTLEAGVDDYSSSADWTVNSTLTANADEYLYINEGWYPNTQIKVSNLVIGSVIGEQSSSDQIRAGFEAYDASGNKLTGTIADWIPDSNYYITSNTGYGRITKGTYVSTTKDYFIKNGTIDLTPSGTNITLSDTNNGIAVTGGAVTEAGWVPTTSATATKYLSQITIPENTILGSEDTPGIILSEGSNIYISDGANTYSMSNDLDGNEEEY